MVLETLGEPELDEIRPRPGCRPGKPERVRNRPSRRIVPPASPSARSSSGVTTRSASSASIRVEAHRDTRCSLRTPGHRSCTRCRPAMATAPAYIGPAASGSRRGRQISPAAATIGHVARERRRLTCTMATSDDISARSPGIRVDEPPSGAEYRSQPDIDGCPWRSAMAVGGPLHPRHRCCGQWTPPTSPRLGCAGSSIWNR